MESNLKPIPINEQIIAVVCGYGSAENPGYNQYLSGVKGDLLAMQESRVLDSVVTCGAYTDPNNPSQSEAAFVSQQLERPTNRFESTQGSTLRRNSQQLTCDFREEPVSTTTPENLTNALKIISPGYVEGQKIIIYCDKIRKFKAAFQIAILTFNFVQKFSTSVRGIDRPDDHIMSTNLGQMISIFVELPLLVANKGALDAAIFHHKRTKPSLIKLIKILKSTHLYDPKSK